MPKAVLPLVKGGQLIEINCKRNPKVDSRPNPTIQASIGSNDEK